MQMSSEERGFRHGALVYESQDEYVACAVPFLKEGLEAGEGAIVAHTKPGLAMMREALGPDAAHVTFVDVSSAYTRPARTLASYYHVYVEELGKSPSLRLVADVQFGPDPAEWDLWTAYEAVFNRSYAHLPAWVVCTYSANGTPDRIIDGVWRTHPEVRAGDTWHTSDRFEDPDELLGALTPEPRPLSGLRSIGFGGDLEEFRERLARKLAAAKVSDASVLDMLLAATEIAENALEHGGGVQDVRVGHADGRFVCEVVDRGEGFDDPAAGYIAPRPGVGRGLWVARQLTWRLEFFPSADGFTVRLWL
jgi:anti-sigma regulatory factor (Ser/Thr protein kinase)